MDGPAQGARSIVATAAGVVGQRALKTGGRGDGAQSSRFSEREPRIGEDRVVAGRVVRAAQVRTVEIIPAAEEMQIFGELQTEAHVPFRVQKGRAFAERNVGEVEDQTVAVRAAGEAVVECAEVDRRAKRIGA